MDIKLSELIEFFCIFFRNDFVCNIITSDNNLAYVCSVGSADDTYIYKVYKYHNVVAFGFNRDKVLNIVVQI